MLQDRIYVTGTVRKDAVEIIPVEVPLTAAPILAAKYNEGWVPNRIRTITVDVGEEGLTAAMEHDRLVNLYGAEHVAAAFGTKVAAVMGINALMKLDSAQAVAEAGIIPAVGDIPISLQAPPVKGTKAYAQRAAAEAHPDDLKPVTDGPNDTAATAAAQASAQANEDQRRADEQASADQRRKDIADQAASVKANKDADEVSADNSTKADMQAELDKRGVEYPASATKADLQQLLDDNPAQPGEGDQG